MRSASRTRVQAILLRNLLQLGPVCRNYHHAVPTKPPLCPSESDFMSPPNSPLPTPRCTPSFPLVPCFFSFSFSLFCPTADQSVNGCYCARLCGRAAVCLGRNSSPARPPHARRDPADCGGGLRPTNEPLNGCQTSARWRGHNDPPVGSLCVCVQVNNRKKECWIKKNKMKKGGSLEKLFTKG